MNDTPLASVIMSLAYHIEFNQKINICPQAYGQLELGLLFSFV